MYLHINTFYANKIFRNTEGVFFYSDWYCKYIKYEAVIHSKSYCYKSFYLSIEIFRFVDEIDICETGLRIYLSSPP
jgi:hypothetical protein